MTRSRFKLPPVMERTPADDLKWAALVLAGAVLAFLVLGADDVGVLVGAAIGVIAVVVVLSVLRRGRPPGGS
jgi:hypothetical protein